MLEDKCPFWKVIRDSGHTCAAMEMRVDEWGNEEAYCEACWENCPVFIKVYKVLYGREVE